MRTHAASAALMERRATPPRSTDRLRPRPCGESRKRYTDTAGAPGTSKPRGSREEASSARCRRYTSAPPRAWCSWGRPPTKHHVIHRRGVWFQSRACKRDHESRRAPHPTSTTSYDEVLGWVEREENIMRKRVYPRHNCDSGTLIDASHNDAKPVAVSRP